MRELQEAKAPKYRQQPRYNRAPPHHCWWYRVFRVCFPLQCPQGHGKDLKRLPLSNQNAWGQSYGQHPYEKFP